MGETNDAPGERVLETQTFRIEDMAACPDLVKKHKRDRSDASVELFQKKHRRDRSDASAKSFAASILSQPRQWSPFPWLRDETAEEFNYRKYCCCGMLHITTGTKIIAWVQVLTFLLYLVLPFGTVALGAALMALGADEASIEVTNRQTDHLDYDYDDDNFTMIFNGVEQSSESLGNEADLDSYYHWQFGKTTYAVVIAILIVCLVLFGVLPITLLLVGVHMRKRHLLLPYMLVTAISIVVGAFCLNPLAILHTWFLYVVFRCYRYLRWCHYHKDERDCASDVRSLELGRINEMALIRTSTDKSVDVDAIP